MNKIRQILKDILYVSKLTKIQRKKVRILFSAVISNSISFADIVIILTFSSLLTDSEITSNQYLDFITNNPILIVFIVIIRYVLNFLGKYNVYSLTKDIEQSLKVYLLKEVYKKGNYSLADATYYIETLSGHIAYFFNAFTNVMSSFIQVIVFTIFLTYSNIEALSAFGILLIVLYYPTKYLLVKGREAMEDSYKFSQFSARYIQRIIDNLFLVKILNTHEYEVNNFDNNLTNLYRTEKKKFTLQDINASIPNFIAVFSFSLILTLSIAGIKLTLEFIGVTLRLMQSIGGLNSAMSMLVSTHVHLDKLLLVERNRNLESNFS